MTSDASAAVNSQLRLHILASGSKGNACVVQSANTKILIDCGISYRELTRRAAVLNVDLSDIAATVVTHEHSDHTAGLSVWCKHFTGPMLATKGTAGARKHLAVLPFKAIDRNADFEIGDIRVRCFPTSHDVVDPIGFRFEAHGDALGYCTDSGVLTQPALELLHNVRILALEANHDPRMLAHSSYPLFLQERIGGAQGHLSNEQACTALTTLVTKKTEYVIAMHLSQENNRPGLAVKTLSQAVGATPQNDMGTRAATADKFLSIVCAAQDAPMTIE
ncbi:MBL fold metallo-hydrolase [Atopobium fossor]|uniref:MBL fold metallo-hydrolase n=1 Tax=Atopobium fossor TaxID=39487 RepID=UPI0004842FAE|nr:MBL fold metallo-hydrolase [Atopobium fossor]